jgi:hypothetical protein
LYSSMAITTCLALTGNVQVGLVGHTGSPFAWLEAMAPPIVVLSTAYVLKEQLHQVVKFLLSQIETPCQVRSFSNYTFIGKRWSERPFLKRDRFQLRHGRPIIDKVVEGDVFLRPSPYLDYWGKP